MSPLDEEAVGVTLAPMQWAEVCAALRHYVGCEAEGGAHGYPASQADALAALREIDRVMLGADEPAPPDDVLP